MDFNSRNYDWDDITIAIDGKIYDGVVEFKIKATQDKDYRRGRGNNPHGIARGNLSYEATIGLWQRTALEIQEDFGGNLLNAEVTIVCNYAQANSGNKTITAVGEFKEFEIGGAQGDKNLIVNIPMICLQPTYE